MRVAVSILTNGARRELLQGCIDSFLQNSRYRPIDIVILDNGSTDDTKEYLHSLNDMYGVRFIYDSVPKDLGCAAGVNRLASLTGDYDYVLHLESDFHHLSSQESGFDYMWMKDALEFMESGRCDYLYLRRIRNEVEMRLHWWPQWAHKINTHGKYMHCPNFWWSNNPHLRRNEMIYASGVLPLDESKDGPKGTEGWSKPELEAGSPGREGMTWVAKWGIFIHEAKEVGDVSCPKGLPSCKYGFAVEDSKFCNMCDESLGFDEMAEHDRRYRCLVTG